MTQHLFPGAGKGRETHRLFVVVGPPGAERVEAFQFKSLFAAWRRLKWLEDNDFVVQRWSITSL